MVFPNDVTLDERGTVYATDSIGGTVWRIPEHGAAEVWSDDPVLAGNGAFGLGFPIGANGIVTRGGEVLVGTTETGLLVSIPILPDGSAGTPQVLSDEILGVDGMAVDVIGSVYVATSTFNTLLRVDRDGSVTTLATATDGLNQPSTLAFGTSRGEQKTLYVLNFSAFVPNPTPGVLKVSVGVPGAPVP